MLRSKRLPCATSFALAAALVGANAQAEEWRFCVGLSPSAHEAVITDIFASGADSAKLEHRLEAYFRTKNGHALTFQCPRGGAQRLDAMNGQTAALRFNRNMGFTVNGLSAAELASATGPGM